MRGNMGQTLKITQVIVVAIVLAVLVRVFAIGIYKVPTSSMLPNLFVGDVIYAWKFPFQAPGRLLYKLFSGKSFELYRGDIIVFKHPKNESFYVKRIVGVPGDKIKIQKERLYVNDIEVQSIKSQETSNFEGRDYYQLFSQVLVSKKFLILQQKELQARNQSDIEVVVKKDSFFVLGDNRDSSVDSRDWGLVPRQNIEGVVERVVLSYSWNSPVNKGFRSDRIWSPVQ